MPEPIKHSNYLYFAAFCVTVFYTLLSFFSGFISGGLLTLVTLLLIAIAYYLNTNQKTKLSGYLLLFASLTFLINFDSNIADNTGFIFYYLVFFLIINSNQNLSTKSKYLSFILLVIVFILTNSTNFFPALGSAINNKYQINFTFYINLFFAFGIFSILQLKPKTGDYNTENLNSVNVPSYLNFIANNVDDAVWVLNQDLEIIYCNNVFNEISKNLKGTHLDKGKNGLAEIDDSELYNFWKGFYEETKKQGKANGQRNSLIKNKQVEYIIKAEIIDNVFIFIKAHKKENKESIELKTVTENTFPYEVLEDVVLEFDEKNICKAIWYSNANKLIYPESYYLNNNLTKLFDEPFKIKLTQLAQEARLENTSKQIDYSFKVNGVIKHYTAKIKPKEQNGLLVVIEDNTERKKLFLELNRHKEFLDKLINNLPVGISVKDVSKGLTYTLWNKEMQRLFNVSEKDVLGKTDAEIFKSFEQIEAYSETDNMVVESKEPLLINKLQITTDTGQLILRNIKLPLLDKQGNVQQIIGIIENITQITLTQEELETTERRLNFALSGSRDAVWDINLATGEVYFSPVFKKMLGYNENEDPQLSLNDLMFKEDLNAVNEKLVNHLTGKTDYYEAEYRLHKKDGSVLWVLDRGKICETDETGSATRITGTFTDITYKKQLEEQIIAAKNEAEGAAKAKSLFLSTMSHEIRTPMNAVTGMINLLAQNATNEQKELINTLKFSADNLMYLLNDILDFSKIDAGKLELEKIEFNLKPLAQKTIEMYGLKAKEKEINISLQFDEAIPQNLVGDPVRIGQVVSNLISNAVKFTQQGNILVEMILRNKTEDEASIEIAVSDTGIGIEENKLNFIFEAFSQAQTDISRNYGGTGLGLAICKKLVELFGSKIYVTSKPGVGSKFWFTIKLPYITKSNVAQIATDETTPTVSLQGMRVLVAEDNMLNQYVLTRFLTNWGIEFDTAENGLEAIEFFRKKKYDLILMDLQMPELDGIEATKVIRKTNKSVQIFALTANAFNDVKEKVMQIGMNDFITKPFQPNELLKKLIKVYEESKKQPVSLKLFN